MQENMNLSNDLCDNTHILIDNSGVDVTRRISCLYINSLRH